jgi:hypothetical protein
MEENHQRLIRPLVRRKVQLGAPGGRIAAAIGMRRTGKTCLMIQACWDVRDPATLIREREALDEAKLELGLEGRILTMAGYLEELAGLAE